jgi:hypothetical protein
MDDNISRMHTERYKDVDPFKEAAKETKNFVAELFSDPKYSNTAPELKDAVNTGLNTFEQFAVSQPVTVPDEAAAENGLAISNHMYGLADKMMGNMTTAEAKENSWVNKIECSPEVAGARLR